MKNEKSRFFYNYFKRLQVVNIVYNFRWLALCLVPLNTYEKRRLKTDTVKRLLGYRYHVTGEGFSRALNEAFIIFADNSEVVKAIESLHVTITTPGKPDVDNKLLSVFKAVCKDLKCLPKDINDTYFLKAFNIIK